MRDNFNSNSHYASGLSTERTPGHDFFSDLRCKFAAPPIDFPPEMFKLKEDTKDTFRDLGNYSSLQEYYISPDCLYRPDEKLDLEALVQWENLDDEGKSTTKMVDVSEINPDLKYLFLGSAVEEISSTEQ